MDLLFGQSRRGRSISFRGDPPIWHRTMEVLALPTTEQARDAETGEPKFWKIKGTKEDDLSSPQWQIVIKVATDYRNPDLDDDDGVRWLYIGGSPRPESRSQWASLAAAVRKAGVAKILPGGKIDIGYIRDGQKAPGASAVSNPPKQYEVVYTPPPEGYVPPGAASDDYPPPDEPPADDEPPF
jgi:hypothetical protein